MRFGIYIRSLASARGAEQVAYQLALGLAERGNRVDVLLEDTDGTLARRIEEIGGNVTVVDLCRSRPLRLRRVIQQTRAALATLGAKPSSNDDSRIARFRDAVGLAVGDDAPLGALRDYVDGNRPDGVLSLLNYPNFAALLASRLCRASTRFVVSVHNHISTASQNALSAQQKRVPLLISHLFRYADAIVAPSSGVIDDLSRIKGVPVDKLHVVPNPAFEPQVVALAEQSPHHRWLDPASRPVILGVGKLKPQKDFSILLRAFARVRAQAAVRLIILGEGGERDALAALADQLGIARDVDFPGFVDNPYAFYRRASLFVLSSAWEGFGNVLIEAMACGCPVVSTDCPSGPAEILEGGRWGTLVPVGDADALAAAMIEMLRSPTQPTDLVARAQIFSRAKAAEHYEALLAGA